MTRAESINKPMLEACFKTLRALRELGRLGCTAVDVKIGARSPIITIEAGAQADAIGGAMYMREVVGGKVIAWRVAIVEGCQVRWSVPLPPPISTRRTASGTVVPLGTGRAA